MTLALVLALMAGQATFVPVTAEERYVADLRAQIAKGDVEAEVAVGTCKRPGVCCHRTRRRRRYGIGGLRTRVTPARS